MQGIYHFQGVGMEKPVPLHSELSHYVPDGVVNQALYFRGGNSSAELIAVVLMRNGVPMRDPVGELCRDACDRYYEREQGDMQLVFGGEHFDEPGWSGDAESTLRGALRLLVTGQ